MDNGTEFINETISEVIKLLGTSQAAILAHSKEENAIVERCNKETMRHINAMIFEVNKRNSWKIHIPLAQRIINSEVHSRLGVSPNDLVFGGKLNLQGGFLHEKDEQHINKRRSNNAITEFRHNSFVLIQYPKSVKLQAHTGSSHTTFVFPTMTRYTGTFPGESNNYFLSPFTCFIHLLIIHLCYNTLNIRSSQPTIPLLLSLTSQLM